MLGSRLNKSISSWLKSRFGAGLPEVAPPTRGQTIHVIIIDGTMSTLEPGDETNAGLTAKLLGEMGAEVSLYYEPGLQWSHWRKGGDVIFGRGINRQIRRAYGYLASRYRPGDKVFLFGYSRGAYAVRSLAGIIDRVGLLRSQAATERNIRDVYRHYECSPDGDAARIFARNNCHKQIDIEMIGVWDTVKSLGLNMPYLWRLSAPRHAFHNHQLGKSVKHGFQALARNETRVAYAPVMWDTRDDWDGHLLQMWFRGTHGDVGGHLTGYRAARPLANIPLVWMLERQSTAVCRCPISGRVGFRKTLLRPRSAPFADWAGGLSPAGRAWWDVIHPSVCTHPSRRGRTRPCCSRFGKGCAKAAQASAGVSAVS